LRHFDDFGLAFDNLGASLVPIEGVPVAEVKRLYRQYYSDEDVLKYGVLCVGLEGVNRFP
jgi:ASC-1-like (ASCH) protein